MSTDQAFPLQNMTDTFSVSNAEKVHDGDEDGLDGQGEDDVMLPTNDKEPHTGITSAVQGYDVWSHLLTKEKAQLNP